MPLEVCFGLSCCLPFHHQCQYMSWMAIYLLSTVRELTLGGTALFLLYRSSFFLDALVWFPIVLS